MAFGSFERKLAAILANLVGESACRPDERLRLMNPA